MKKTCVLLALFIGGFSSSLMAGLVPNAAVWDFDTGTAYNGTTPYAANSRNATVFSSASMTSVTLGNANLQSAGSGDGGGKALQLTAPTTGSSSARNVNGASFVLSFKAAAAINAITITYNYLATSGSGTALNTWTLSGVSGTQTASITQNGAWNSASVTFSGLTLASGNTFTLTDALSGYSTSGGNIAEFDNISFSATGPTLVPEPITYALPLFGLVFIGGIYGRRLIRKSEQN